MVEVWYTWAEDNKMKKEFIKTAKDDTEAASIMMEDVKKRFPEHEIDYTRWWESGEGEKTYDVGFWSRWYLTKEVKKVEA